MKESHYVIIEQPKPSYIRHDTKCLYVFQSAGDHFARAFQFQGQKDTYGASSLSETLRLFLRSIAGGILGIATRAQIEAPVEAQLSRSEIFGGYSSYPCLSTTN
eukprot:Gregarina_sp_Poly_1__5491@NODE_28_length_19636_cov_263_287087_g25_i0_p17_GENE_NODE_28_length_19636_cov_263_287087_g25_i0NODE_28_length_19636_cov_263_287087_g25_i0_p17_ORF_typecomplete_len104_score7_26_NODE_28_length_19636_cov_263_287087_g25_i01560115912